MGTRAVASEVEEDVVLAIAEAAATVALLLLFTGLTTGKEGEDITD